jgi:hypothetical protein
VVINEVNYAGHGSLWSGSDLPSGSAQGDATPDQWVELYNMSTTVVRLLGWRLENSSGSDLLPDISIEPGGYLILAADPERFKTMYPALKAPIVALPGQNVAGGLSTVADFLILGSAAGRQVDSLSYGAGDFDVAPNLPVVSPGHSLERAQPGIDTDQVGDFIDQSLPTPAGFVPPANLWLAPVRLPANENIRDRYFSRIPTPLETFLTPVAVLASNMLLAVLMALIFGVCSTILDNAFRSSESTLAGTLAGIPIIGSLMTMRRENDRPVVGKTLGMFVRLFVVLFLYAALFSLLDSEWRPWGPGGLFLLTTAFLSSALVGFAGSFAQGAAVKKWGFEPSVKYYPANLLVATGAVAASRILLLQPGLIFGAPGGMEYDDSAETERRGEILLWVGVLTLVGLAAVSWFLSFGANQLSLVAAADGNAGAANFLAGARNVTLLIFLATLEGLFFGLIPVGNTEGVEIWRTRKLAWVALFIPIGLLMVQILFNPDNELTSAFQAQSFRQLFFFLGAIIALTAVVWLYFRGKGEAPEPAAD